MILHGFASRNPKNTLKQLKTYTPNREKKSFVKKLRVSKSEFLNFFPESQSKFLNFGCLLPRQVVRNAPECNLRNYQTLDWAEKNKKFQSLSRQSVFLMIGPGCNAKNLKTKPRNKKSNFLIGRIVGYFF